MAKTLMILGLPLQESPKLPPALSAHLKSADLIIGESRRLTDQRLQAAEVPNTTPAFYLDNLGGKEKTELEKALRNLKDRQKAVLFSDMGMPILFDPGADVLEMARKLGFQIKSEAGPTSWGTASALSGFSPPFLLVGFPPQKTEARVEFFRGLSAATGHLILMDTPYRFTKLLEECETAFGQRRQAFLGWEIGLAAENLIWGTLPEIQAECRRRGLVKGEFILVVKSV